MLLQPRRPRTRLASAAPRAPAVFCYSGDRARGAIGTERRRTQPLCLECLPGGPIDACPRPLHPANARDSAGRTYWCAGQA